jgi:hypothetical protein
MSIIIRIITGVIQDRDDNSYDNVVVVYVVLSACSVAVAASMFVGCFWTSDLAQLQWTRRQRITKGEIINVRREEFESGSAGRRNRKISMSLFVALLFLVVGSWAAYFWGVATGNNG